MLREFGTAFCVIVALFHLFFGPNSWSTPPSTDPDWPLASLP